MNEAERTRKSFLALQEEIRSRLLSLDSTAKVREDEWERKEGGGGRTLAISGGKIMEKGGINFSDVRGNKLPPSATLNRPELGGSKFRAMGVSVVFHPQNPHVPTAHANVRYFEATPPNREKVWWFGGGFDLTPYYPFHEDVIFWHQSARQICDDFGQHLYPKFKKWCDDYFYLPHRNETRGVGGIFFDDFAEGGFEKSLNFAESVGKTFSNAFFEITQKRNMVEFTEKQKAFQRYRRGRYVEFNLIYDRGTHFGLQSNGRTESILMSLPPSADWAYSWYPQEGSQELELYEEYLKPRDWLGENSL